MSLFVGTKVIKPVAMTLGDYNKLQGWDIPKDQDPDTEGFLVEYLDGGKPNHPDFEGYISWSPKEVFNKAYKGSGNLSFGAAIMLAQLGYRVSRKGWNGADMFAYIVPANTYPAQTEAAKGIFPDDMVPYREYWALKTAQGDVATWAPSGSDSLANDWGIYQPTTFLDRLQTERDQLADKHDKLYNYIGTDHFNSIDSVQQVYLRNQVGHMKSYLKTLDSRLYQIKSKG